MLTGMKDGGRDEDGFLVGVGVMWMGAIFDTQKSSSFVDISLMENYQVTDLSANFSFLTHPIGNAISISCRLTLVSIDGGGVEAFVALFK